jgi:hypothetical protein
MTYCQNDFGLEKSYKFGVYVSRGKQRERERESPNFHVFRAVSLLLSVSPPPRNQRRTDMLKPERTFPLHKWLELALPRGIMAYI